MQKPIHHRRHLGALTLPACCALLLSFPVAAASAPRVLVPQDLVTVRSLSGSPRVLVPAGDQVLFPNVTYRLRAGDRIRTGPGDRALVALSSSPACRFILEPNSVLELAARTPSGVFRARLSEGSLRCPSAACGATFEVETPAGRVRGRRSAFLLKAHDNITSVEVRAGHLLLKRGGLSIPLRPLTQTIISPSGIHRIRALDDGFASRRRPRRGPPASASPALGLVPGGIAPVSAPTRP